MSLRSMIIINNNTILSVNNKSMGILWDIYARSGISDGFVIWLCCLRFELWAALRALLPPYPTAVQRSQDALKTLSSQDPRGRRLGLAQ